MENPTMRSQMQHVMYAYTLLQITNNKNNNIPANITCLCTLALGNNLNDHFKLQLSLFIVVNNNTSSTGVLIWSRQRAKITARKCQVVITLPGMVVSRNTGVNPASKGVCLSVCVLCCHWATEQVNRLTCLVAQWHSSVSSKTGNTPAIAKAFISLTFC